MRKLMWFSIGFAMACGSAVAFLWDRNLLPYSVSCLLAAVIILLLSRKIAFLRPLSALAFGIGSGLIWFYAFHTVYIAPLQQYDGETVHLVITVTGYDEKGQYSSYVDGFTALEGKPYRLRLYFSEDVAIEPGVQFDGEFRLRLKTREGSGDSSYDSGNGIYLTASQKGEARVIHPEKTPFYLLPAVVARAAKNNIERCFPADTRAFAKALLLGDTKDLSYSDDTALKISGIRHIVAVSGLHVSILFGLLLLLFDSNRILMPLVSIPLLCFFAGITGFSPSVSRACLMTGIMVIGSSIHEEYDSLTGLSFAALVMLILNPYVIQSVSFQLSVCSVAGILLFSAQIKKKCRIQMDRRKTNLLLNKVIYRVIDSFSVSVGSLLLTTPLMAYYFGTVSLVGVLTNLLTIWSVSFIFCGIAFAAAFGGVLFSVCKGIAWCVSWLIRLVMAIARVLSGIPFAAVYTQSVYIVAWIGFAYLLISLFFILGRKHVKRFILTGAAALAAAILISVVQPRLDDFRLTVMSVGEGQSILIQNDGLYFLVDCGGDSDTEAANIVAQTLLSQGITRLDGIALTHYDRDHAGGLANLLTRIPADKLFFPVMDGDTFAERNLFEKSEVYRISQNTQLQFGNAVLTLSAPGQQKSENENCMCVLFESEDCDILITGDRGSTGEKDLLATMDVPDVDVLIAGHHGSKNSTSDVLLDAVRPEIVIISVGADNTYGHPAQSVLDRLEQFGCTVYRTDLDGTVVVRR